MADPWYMVRPEQTDKNKLEGMELNVLADCPPKPLKLKSGAIMNSLTVFNPETSASYKILVTDTDIDNICRIVSKGKKFTFVIPKGKQWAEVGEYVQKPN